MRASGFRSHWLPVSLFVLLATLSPLAMAQKQEAAVSPGGVLPYKSGVDVKPFGWLSLRGEFRNFDSGSPAYNIGGVSGGGRIRCSAAALCFASVRKSFRKS